jgi:hypothetical protein
MGIFSFLSSTIGRLEEGGKRMHNHPPIAIPMMRKKAKVVELI